MDEECHKYINHISEKNYIFKFNYKRVIFFTLFLICFTTAFSFKVHFYPEEIKITSDDFIKFKNTLVAEEKYIKILEADTLGEFSRLTGLDFHTFAGIYTRTDSGESVIITLPFRTLNSRNIFEQTIKHELMHFYLDDYKLSGYLQEGVILYFSSSIKKTDKYYQNYITFEKSRKNMKIKDFLIQFKK